MFTDFSRDRSKNSRPSRIVLIVNQYTAIVIEPQKRSILTADIASRSYDDGADDIAFFHATFRISLFDGANDDISDMCVSALGSFQDFKAADSLSARIISNF
jgi:hypothetical protein